jgi:hypothetical protein
MYVMETERFYYKPVVEQIQGSFGVTLWMGPRRGRRRKCNAGGLLDSFNHKLNFYIGKTGGL